MNLSKTKKLFLLLVGFILVTFFIAYENAAYTYAKEKPLLLTPKIAIDDKNLGKTFIYKGVVKKIYKSKQGILNIRSIAQDGGMDVNVTVFPSLGVLPVKINSGDTIEVIGTLKKYKQRIQIYPLSISSIQKISDTCESAISLKEVEEHQNKYVTLTDIDITGFREYVSKKNGKKMLLFTIAQNNTAHGGIMYEGDWTQTDKKHLGSGKVSCMRVRIGEYKGKVSIAVKEIIK